MRFRNFISLTYLTLGIAAAAIFYEGCSFIIDPHPNNNYSEDSGTGSLDILDLGNYDISDGVTEYDLDCGKSFPDRCAADDDAKTLDAAVDNALADNPVANQDISQPEVCDGIDNDGDGKTDEDFPSVGLPCNGYECGSQDVNACSPDQRDVFCFTESREPRNPGFEMGYVAGKIPCWETIEGRPELVLKKGTEGEGNGPVCEGTYALKPGEANGERYVVRQVINVSAYAQNIDSGNQMAVIRELATFNNDKGGLELIFYDSNGSRINSSLTSNEITGNLCTEIENPTVVPAGTRYIGIKLSGENMDGNTNNASHDAINLELTTLNN